MIKIALPYNDSVGHSGTDTSEERAECETAVASEKQAKVMLLLRMRGAQGLTVKELRQRPFVNHHGTASGILSNLNKAGRIEILEEKRGGCHVYVLPAFVGERAIYERRPNDAYRKGRVDALGDVIFSIQGFGELKVVDLIEWLNKKIEES